MRCDELLTDSEIRAHMEAVPQGSSCGREASVSNSNQNVSRIREREASARPAGSEIERYEVGEVHQRV